MCGWVGVGGGGGGSHGGAGLVTSFGGEMWGGGRGAGLEIVSSINVV